LIYDNHGTIFIATNENRSSNNELRNKHDANPPLWTANYLRGDIVVRACFGEHFPGARAER
jgi:hypothetical protein